jgi:hypothetical protein
MTVAITEPSHGKQTLPDELIYEYHASFTDVTDYGVSLADVLSGAAAPPPAGLRCDVAFEGRLTGPRFRGCVQGTDYGNLLANGRGELHIHARITTDDGKRIALAAHGTATLEPGSATAQISESVTLTTSEPEYAWVNTLPIRAAGTADFATGEIRISAYASAGIGD